MNIKREQEMKIAIKIPKSKYDKTLAYYQNILNCAAENKPANNTVSETHQSKFGNNSI